jgi:thiamine pyrophosphate-dependent acetolactate synthase large subunit-like protein
MLAELRRRGVTTVFGVPGREAASLLFTEVPDLQHITARTEFTAGMMAAHMGRLTGEPQVAFCTMGPGATNMVTAVATAMLNHSPMVLISAQLESDDRLYNVTHQCVDQRSIFQPVTKWSHEVSHPESLRWDLDRAFAIAAEDPPGPVHLSIPVDFLSAQVPVTYDQEEDDLPGEILGQADGRTLEVIRAALEAAEQPICIIGDEIVRARCGDEARRFVESWGLPTLCGANVKGVLPGDHALSLGSVSPYMEGILGEPMLDRIFGPADLVVCVGVQYVDDILPNMWRRGREQRVIVISGSPLSAEREKLAASVESVGQHDRQLAALAETADVEVDPRRSRPDDVEWAKGVYRRRVARAERPGSLDPVAALSVINRRMAEGAALVSDIGYFRHHAILFSEPEEVGRMFTETALSSFGSGLSVALATKLHEPEREVFLIAGDGGFHSTSPDLSTAVHYDIPITVVLLNSGSFELIGRYQQRGGKGINRSLVELGAVDFVELAEANGWAGARARSRAELEDALNDRDPNRPCLIEAPCNYDGGDVFEEAY